MSKKLFVIGTDTDVGKTFVTAGIIDILRKNRYHACGFKPVQSGGILTGQRIISGDIAFVNTVTSMQETESQMNSYCFKEAVSPHLAAEMENVKIDKSRILEDLKKLERKYDYIVIEGAGGIVVPLIRNRYYIYDLVKDLDVPVVIVARAGVGTINHTTLTVNFIKHMGIKIKGLIFNGYHNHFYENDSIDILKHITGLAPILCLHQINAADKETFIQNAKMEYEKSLEIEKILSLF